MLFNSYVFIFFFLPITFFIYFYLNHKRLTEASKGFLVFSSLFFYSWWNPIYLPIILVSMIFNYGIGEVFSQDKFIKVSKKTVLWFAIFSNITLLGYFKYMDFFISNVNYITGENIGFYHLALPLGISFFTFQQISYLVDSYRGETTEYDFLNYALFVTFFPQLIAGPIVHHKEMMPQFAKTKNKVINYKNIAKGLFIFSIGLFKKVIIADTFAIWATQGFDVATTLNLFEAWATSLSYTFQLYFDFSGYSDMAIGLGLLFNIQLPINFYSPYKSTSLIQFWQKWHITLSKFVNEYIFTPLLKAFGKYTFTKGMIAIFISMLLIGLWHGASWMFVLFGAIHGVGIIINHIWKKKIKIKIHHYIGWLLTFNTINISLIFFRAKGWDDAIKVLGSMFHLDNLVLPRILAHKLLFLSNYGFQFGYFLGDIHGGKMTIISLLIAFIITLFFKNSIQYLNSFSINYKTMLFTSILLTFSILSLQKISEFLYFNF